MKVLIFFILVTLLALEGLRGLTNIERRVRSMYVAVLGTMIYLVTTFQNNVELYV